jgi:predicted murein hydrolase (TIGR00659 family)
MLIDTLKLIDSLLLTVLTLILYQAVAWVQQKWQLIWLNPMLFTIIAIIPYLLINNIDYPSYRQSTQLLNALLEPATVALGYPLYQQLKHIKQYWKQLVMILILGVVIVITISFTLTMLLIHQQEIAIALSLKSVTTPIGITLTEQLNGDSSITAFAIMIAGFSGAILGPVWLRFINIRSDIAVGLAIGTGSHVIGSIILSKHNVHQGAYSSVALIISALLTALIIPVLVPLLLPFFS